MRVPYGHIHIGRFTAVDVEIQYLIGTDPAELYPGFAFDNRKTFGLAGMEMIAAGNAGMGGGERYLSAGFQFHGFHEAAPVIGLQFKFYGKKFFVIDIADKCIEQVPFERIAEGREDTLIEILLFIIFKKCQDFGDFFLGGMGDGEAGDW